jgi:hypothetical protein
MSFIFFSFFFTLIGECLLTLTSFAIAIIIDHVYSYLMANYLQGGIPADIGNLSHLTIL